jgi:AmmeMemoRadiSam system protein A
MSDAKGTRRLSETEEDLLLKVARLAVEGAARGEPEAIVCDAAARSAAQLGDLGGASFVTVYVNGRLNGCLGSLETRRKLVDDVAHNAYNAAAADPRFPRLQTSQLTQLGLHASILSPLERMPVWSFAEVLSTVRPGVDGLLIEAGRHRGTLLPSVWKNVPEPKVFLMHLWEKAGLEAGTWPDGMKVFRYTTQEFSDER